MGTRACPCVSFSGVLRDVFQQQVIATFCPDSMSLAQLLQKEDKIIQFFIVPAASSKSKALSVMREELASQPWRLNYFRIPGLEVLEHNKDVLKQKVIATFCLDFMS